VPSPRLILSAVVIALLFNSSADANWQRRRAMMNAAANAYAMNANYAARVPYVARRPMQTPATAAEANGLRQAYTVLSQADHDYQGHRVQAMKAIHKAGRMLGINLQGDGHNKEQQGTSDSQLRQAQGILQQVRTSLASRNQIRATPHVDAALRHLSTALSIK